VLREIGGNIPVKTDVLSLHSNNSDVFGCGKFKYNLYTFSARSALNVLLEENYNGEKNVALPVYTCDTCISPFLNHGFHIEFYCINDDLSIDEDSFLESLNKISYKGILFVHSYFGFDTLSSVKPLLRKLRQEKNLIIINDYTQSWLNDKKEIEADYYLASIRKWLSTPDGGVLSSDAKPIVCKQMKQYCKEQVDEYVKASLKKNLFLENDANVDKSEFYPLFKHSIAFFEQKDVYALSPLSKTVFDNTDYEYVKTRRIANASYLCERISNPFVDVKFKSIPQGIVPFYFPVFIKNGRRAEFQKYLMNHDIFCTIHWIPSVHIDQEKINRIYPEILSLVCDQRYDEEDMERFVNVVNSFQ
jgi:hypothetical protein